MPHTDLEARRAYHREWTKKRKEADPEYKKKLCEAVKRSQAKNPEKKKAQWANWYEKNSEAYKALRTSQRNRDEEYAREMRRQYGLSKADYDEMVLKVDGKCEICGKSAKLNVDHCHKSGFVRGLLCFACNTAIGHFEDDPARIANALRYLERAGCELPKNVWELWPIREPEQRRVRLLIKRYGKRDLKKRECLRCGTMFEALRSDAKYCSRKCQDLQSYNRWKGRNLNAVSETRMVSDSERLRL